VQRTGAELLVRLADPDLAGEIAWLVSTSELRTRRPLQAGSTIAAALARPGMSNLRAGRLQALRAIVLAVHGELADAAAAGQAALERARQAGDRLGIGYALHAMSFVAMHRRDAAAAVALIEQALAAIGDDPQASDLHVMVLANNASCLLDLDRFDEAMAAASEAVVLAERAAIARLAGARFALADQFFSAGQWDDALAELELVTGIPGQDHRQLLVQGLVALIAAHRGDRRTALGQLSGLPDGPLHEPGAARGGLFWDRVVLARALIAEQDSGPAAAVAVLAPCLEPDIGAQMPGRYALLPTLVRLARATGDAKLAAAAAEAADAEAAPAVPSGMPVAVKEALAGHCRGLIDGDPGQLHSAAAYLAATSRPLPAAAALEDAAELLAMQGSTAAARRALTAASEAYARLGASWDLGRAATRLQPFGITPLGGASRLRPATGWGALTPTELKVARFVAEGHSNPDIAAQLFLSRSTVQTHVSHILAKLSARSRAQITAEAFRHLPADGPG
jgi:DNA-binding NarL/FixJ family response regulator